jgi:hypothetical protein
MFDLSLPWWHFVVRAALIYAALMLLVRLSGKRTVGEFTPFDLVVLILLGESVQGGITGGDESVLSGFIVATTLIGMNYLVGFATARSSHIDAIIEGEPVVLVRHGHLNKKALKRNNIPESDLQESLRKAGLTDTEDVELAMLETDGQATDRTRPPVCRTARERRRCSRRRSPSSRTAECSNCSAGLARGSTHDASTPVSNADATHDVGATVRPWTAGLALTTPGHSVFCRDR